MRIEKAVRKGSRRACCITGWKSGKLSWITYARAEGGNASGGEGSGSADESSEASSLGEHGERVLELGLAGGDL
jgi:hypothetical protein